MSRHRKNPLTHSETGMARSWGARFARYARSAPTKTDRARNYALASGILKAACFFGRGRGVTGACSSQSKMLGRAMRAVSPSARRLAGRFRRRNPLLQVVTPNGKRRTRRMKVRGQRRPARRYLKSILGVTSARGLVKRPYGKRRGGLSWRKRKNPLLQVVTPNPVIKGYAGRGGSRVRGGQRLSGVRFVSPSEARTYPGFAKALATFKAFHGRAPTHFTRVRLEDGDKHVSRRAVVMVGEAPAIEYRTWRYANSTKSHTKDGRRITWRHKMGELGGKPAYYVHDPVSGVTSLLGGTYRVAGRPAFYHH